MKTAMEENVFEDRLENRAEIVLPGEGAIIRAGAGSCTFKVTSEMSQGRLGIYEIVVPPHTIGARLHYHRFMDEVFLVKKGTLTVDLFDRQHHLPEGSTVFVPRFTPHAFSNATGDELVITLIFNPSENREGYFKGLFDLLNAVEMDLELFLQLCKKYDTQPVEPSALQQNPIR